MLSYTEEEFCKRVLFKLPAVCINWTIGSLEEAIDCTAAVVPMKDFSVTADRKDCVTPAFAIKGYATACVVVG
jgi:hypothetical protein